MSDLAAPGSIGRFRVTGTLGQGGMGIVYAAHDARLDRAVAIKVIRNDAAGDGAARERLWREARAAAAVSHPNVCQLYEIGEADDQLYLAMELLEGQSLAARLEAGALPTTEALGVTLTALGALEALHERGLVHRDLKPSNVFLTKYGVKLLDFGLARELMSDDQATAADLTLPGKVVGTPAYMAPEQLSGRPVDARTDLFATGALLYEMLTGRSPFAGASMVATMNAVMYERPPALTGSPTIEAADRVIQEALEKAPADRYRSARAMADEIRGVMSLTDQVVSLTQARRRWRASSRASSCCRSAFSGPTSKRTFSPSVSPTPSPGRSRGSIRSSSVRRSQPAPLPTRRPTSSESRPRPTSTRW